MPAGKYMPSPPYHLLKKVRVRIDNRLKFAPQRPPRDVFLLVLWLYRLHLVRQARRKRRKWQVLPLRSRHLVELRNRVLFITLDNCTNYLGVDLLEPLRFLVGLLFCEEILDDIITIITRIKIRYFCSEACDFMMKGWKSKCRGRENSNHTYYQHCLHCFLKLYYSKLRVLMTFSDDRLDYFWIYFEV